MRPLKPGWKSSEFWFTAVSFVFSGLYLIGIIGDISQKDELINNVSHGVESVILIGGQLMILLKYINSRKEIKQTWWNTTVQEEKIEANKKIQKPTKSKRIKKDVKPRTNTK